MVAGGPQLLPASCDISHVISGGVDCGRRRLNVYDKKPQCYAKDNRTAHLTAHSDKSVAYVTNNKRLYSTFCTAEAITTDRHRASCGLFATAELLVPSVINLLIQTDSLMVYNTRLNYFHQGVLFFPWFVCLFVVWLVGLSVGKLLRKLWIIVCKFLEGVTVGPGTRHK